MELSCFFQHKYVEIPFLKGEKKGTMSKKLQSNMLRVSYVPVEMIVASTMTSYERKLVNSFYSC